MLTKQQTYILEAAVNIIIPFDGGANGWQSGVGDYLSRQFEHDLRPLLPIYQQGLDALDNEAVVVMSSGFADLDAEKQELLLRDIEAGRVQTTWPVEPATFFKMFVEHCAEGYYSDPGNGGNRDGVAWKLIGFEVTG